MNKKIKTFGCFMCTVPILLTGCGGVDVRQNTTSIEVGTENIAWEDMIIVKEADKYNVTCDASQVDTNMLGEYTVTYTFENKENQKETTKDFTFKIEDTTAPKITINESKIKIEQGNSYDPLSFVTVKDNYDEMGKDTILVDSNIDNNRLGNYEVVYTAKDSSGNEAILEVPITVVEKITELANKQTIVVDDVCEFYIDFAQITKKVIPPSPASYYSYYAADAGKMYVDVCIAYKNLTSSDIEAYQTMSAQLVYADKYTFTGFSIVEEDSRGDFTYSNITNVSPLTSEYIHYLFEVPEEVKNSSESIVVTVTIAGTDYKYVVR